MRKRLRRALAELLSAEDLVGVYSAFDIVGDIAIIKLLTNTSTVRARIVAETIMNRNKKVKAVFVQEGAVTGNFRLRSLAHVAGENRTHTFHKESGCFFAVDVEKCYFSPKLSGERTRIAYLIQPGETVVNMFAGVGCFSVLIAKRQPTAKVYSVDINPTAVDFMRENVRLNRVYGKVIPLLGDAKEIIQNRLLHCADRVLMPLPEKAFEYLAFAVSALKPSGGWIHVHTFEHATKTEDPLEKFRLKMAEHISSLGVDFEVRFSRIVRPVGPNWHQLVADIQVKGLGKF